MDYVIYFFGNFLGKIISQIIRRVRPHQFRLAMNILRRIKANEDLNSGEPMRKLDEMISNVKEILAEFRTIELYLRSQNRALAA